MFQEFHQGQDQHPDILDRVAISRPQAKSWNWRLTVLVSLLFAMAVWFLFNAYEELTSTAVRYTFQIWVTWIGVGVGSIALASAFLLHRHSQVGWLSTAMLVSFLLVLFMVLYVQFILNLYPGFILLKELNTRFFIELSLFPIMCFMLYLISQKTVRQIFGIPLSWFWACLALGGILGTVAGGLLIF